MKEKETLLRGLRRKGIRTKVLIRGQILDAIRPSDEMIICIKIGANKTGKKTKTVWLVGLNEIVEPAGVFLF